MAKYIHVVINPASGQDQPILNTLNDVFQVFDVDWGVSVTRKSGDAQRFAETAVAEGADVVAAYGGDGTVMEVAQSLIGSDVPLAILPGGTGNLMSVELGIPKNLAKAAEVACRHKRDSKCRYGSSRRPQVYASSRHRVSGRKSNPC
jgi:diacylglycerol kinase family enzyme